MQKELVISRALKVISDTLAIDCEKIREDSRFVEDLGADSLDKVTLIMALEDEFKISISDKQAEGIVCVKDALEALTGAESIA
ncbi:MAG TPA: acyl carrier protein [Chitinispirillaceae bacterium]|jgi:acyl carrier protein|nr:acyl carrier protein [Chitinispirillaceae bacterium]